MSQKQKVISLPGLALINPNGQNVLGTDPYKAQVWFALHHEQPNRTTKQIGHWFVCFKAQMEYTTQLNLSAATSYGHFFSLRVPGGNTF